MSRIANLLTSSDSVPTQSDPEFANYNRVEQRLIVKSGGDKFTLLKLWRRVKGRAPISSASLHGFTVVPAGPSGPCSPEFTTTTYESDQPRLNGNFGASCKILGNEMFVGETGAVGSIFQVGEVHYFTRADESSDWEYDSSFTSPTQANAGEFGASVDYDGTRVVAGESNSSSFACSVFTVTAGVAAIEQEIAPNTYTEASGRSGIASAISDTHLLFSVPSQNLTETDQGGVEYWSRSGTTWTFEQAFTINGTPRSGNQFGGGMCMTSGSTAYIAYCDVSDSNTITIQKWTRSGTTWSYDSEFALTGYTNPATNFAILGTDGTNIIVGQDGFDLATNTNEGLVLVIDQTGSVLTEIIGATGEQIGAGVSINGTESLIGKKFEDVDANTNAGILEAWDVCI